MELTLVWTVAQRELREALHAKWLSFYAFGFAALAFALSQAGMASSGYAGLGGFGRTAASMINALLLFVPLLGLSVGAVTLSGERERGTLMYLLSQPVSRAEIFFGKALGAALAIVAALSLGFGLAGLALATGDAGNVMTYLGLAGLSVLLALVSLGIGFVISALTRKNITALAAALLVWLILVFLGDLGLVGATFAFRPSTEVLFGLLVANPLQAFKVAAIYSLRGTLDTLGIVGQFAYYEFGSSLIVMLLGVMVGWTTAAFVTSFVLFNRRGDV